MTRTADEIVSAWQQRRTHNQRIYQLGDQIKRIYNGDWTLTLPELERAEKTQVANMIATGIDQHALRIASVTPGLICPPVKANKQGQRRADQRRMGLQAWWYANRLDMKRRRRARHLIGYSTSPVYLRPGPDSYPIWEVRDPLASYPAPCAPDDLVPPDCIFAFRRTLGWLRENYDIYGFPTGKDATPDTLYDVLQYCDADVLVLVAVGRLDDTDHQWGAQPQSAPAFELSRVPNLAARPLTVVPGRITLDRLQGQFDQLIGMYEAQGTLWAYHLHALKRTIFGETWLVGRPNENPNVITPADPYQGEVGVVEGGVLENFRPDPGVQTLQAIDRLERGERLTGAIPAEFGGESPSNVRTDKRGLTVMSSTIDFAVQEHQELLAASQEEEDKIGIAIAKAYWGNTPKTFQIPFGKGTVTYTPNVTFETDQHHVTYAYAGTDTNNLVIAGGQRVGMGTLSKYSFMSVDPMVTDPDAEHDRILIEGIEAAHLSAIQHQAADPNGPYQPSYLARLTQLIQEQGLSLYEAEQTAQKELQAQQAQAQQGQLSPDQMQPGNAVPGAPGTPQAGAAIQPPGPSMDNLTQLLQTLRRPQRQGPTEQASGNPLVTAGG